jgi:hypothetical protein
MPLKLLVLLYPDMDIHTIIPPGDMEGVKVVLVGYMVAIPFMVVAGE